MTVRRRTILRLIAIGAAASLLLGSGAAVWAAGALTQAEITACLDSNGYFFQAPAGRACPGASLTWNQAGPPGPGGPQGPPGPQGPAGKPAPSASLAVTRVTKTVKATRNGHFFDTRVPLKSAYVIGCPQGRAATGAGFAAYDDHPHPRTRVPEARLAVMEPIVSQNGTVIGSGCRSSATATTPRRAGGSAPNGGSSSRSSAQSSEREEDIVSSHTNASALSRRFPPPWEPAGPQGPAARAISTSSSITPEREETP